MTEIILLIMGCSLVLLFFVWLVFGRRISSKAATLLIDTGLLALCIAVIICGFMLRQEKYKDTEDGTNKEISIETSTETSTQVNK